MPCRRISIEADTYTESRFHLELPGGKKSRTSSGDQGTGTATR